MAIPTPAAAAASFLLLLLLVTAASANFPKGVERKTHLQYYIHDKLSSPNASVVKVAAPPADPSGARPSVTGLDFGSIYVVDDLITEGPDLSSRHLGRARGFLIVSSADGSEQYFSIQVVFTDGDFKGGSITVTGSDRVLEEVREVEVVGGTGIFRLARGFAFVKTHSLNTSTGDSVSHVDAYILHFK